MELPLYPNMKSGYMRILVAFACFWFTEFTEFTEAVQC